MNDSSLLLAPAIVTLVLLSVVYSAFKSRSGSVKVTKRRPRSSKNEFVPGRRSLLELDSTILIPWKAPTAQSPIESLRMQGWINLLFIAGLFQVGSEMAVNYIETGNFTTQLEYRFLTYIVRGVVDLALPMSIIFACYMMGFVLQKLIVTGKLSAKIGYRLLIAFECVVYVGACIYTQSDETASQWPFSHKTAFLMQTAVLVMKMHSYGSTNNQLRERKQKAMKKHPDNEDETDVKSKGATEDHTQSKTDVKSKDATEDHTQSKTDVGAEAKPQALHQRRGKHKQDTADHKAPKTESKLPCGKIENELGPSVHGNVNVRMHYTCFDRSFWSARCEDEGDDTGILNMITNGIPKFEEIHRGVIPGTWGLKLFRSSDMTEEGKQQLRKSTDERRERLMRTKSGKRSLEADEQREKDVQAVYGEDAVLEGIDDDPAMVYPANITLYDYLVFSFMPVLVYEPRYPRTDRIRLWYVAEKVFLLLFILSLTVVLVATHISPVLLTVHEMHPVKAVASMLFPFTGFWLLIFFLVFECVTNAAAEITRFGDRQFYDDWWNSTTFTEFSRKWNLPVHEWLLRHVYLASRRQGMSSLKALFLTFTISIVAHELIIHGLFGFISPWLLVFSCFQFPLMSLMRMSIIKGKPLGNIVFWFGLVMGVPLITVLYSREYCLRHPDFCIV